jgi:ABC-type amino acid transport substrate-binding protein
MANEVVIPILPCSAIKETLEFYRALGFEVTSEQKQPYTYAAIKYDDIHLQFFVKKNWNPAFVYISVKDVDALHKTFVTGIKQTYGKMLSKGTPRITSVNNLSQDRRFNVIDPSENWLYIGQPLTPENTETKTKDTRLTKALEMARTLAYSRSDAEAAAKVLETALAKNEAEPDTVRFRTYVLRADVAAMLGDTETLEHYVLAAQNIQLAEVDRLELAEEIERLGELENQIGKPYNALKGD